VPDAEAKALTLAIDASEPPDLGSLPAPVREAALGLWGALLKAGIDRTILRPMAQFAEAQNRILYWHDDRSWAKLQAMIREKRFIVVSGDLFGDVTLPAIAKDLAATGQVATVIDLSNALDYFPFTTLKEREQRVEAFIHHLRHLPASPKAAVLVTFVVGNWEERNRAGRDQFAYHALEKTLFEQVFFQERNKPLGWNQWLTDHLAFSNFDDPRRRVELISGGHPHAK
jgi:hypothetical protein